MDSGDMVCGDGGRVNVWPAHERVTVLGPKGRLDAESSLDFRERLRRLVESGVSQLVIDLGEVSSIDSTGLGAIIGGLRRARQKGGDLRIARPSQEVLTVLQLTSLDRVLRPYETIEDAMPGTGAAQEVEVWCDADGDQLASVHEALARFWEEMEAPPADAWRMRFEVAVSEIAANIVEHAQARVMHLRLAVNSGTVVAEFEDAGRSWTGAPEEAPPEPTDMAERGRGLILARRAVDEVGYRRDGTTNRWHLSKRL
jgi:anti-sigma B factor antagonist